MLCASRNHKNLTPPVKHYLDYNVSRGAKTVKSYSIPRATTTSFERPITYYSGAEKRCGFCRFEYRRYWISKSLRHNGIFGESSWSMITGETLMFTEIFSITSAVFAFPAGVS
jgi:hypothetical protein